MTVAVIGAITFGLAKMRPDLPLSPSQPFTGKKDSSGASAAKKGKVIMHVNGEPITEAEFDAFMGAVPEQQRQMFQGPAGRRELANELVRMKTLEQEARRLGYDNDPEAIAQMDLLRTQVTATRTLQKLVEQKAEPEVKAAYEREKKNSMSLRHIIIAYAGGGVPPKAQGQQPPAEAAAMQKASGIVTRLRGGADFGELARAESDDIESGARGGSLGPMRPEMLPPEIASVVSKLKPGQFSDPVKTQFGIHIFNVAEPTLEDLRPMLLQQVQQEIAQKEVNRLQQAAKVELDPQYFPPVTPGQQQAPAVVPPKPRGNT